MPKITCVRVLDRLLLGIAGLSLVLMLVIFFSDESHLSAKPVTSQKSARAEREMPVTLNNVNYHDHQELKSADVDVAMERYFDEIRRNPEKGEEDLRLVDELVPEEAGILPPLSDGKTSAVKPAAAPAAPEEEKEQEEKPKPVKKTERVRITQHEVKSGESIWRLSQKYGVSIATIVNANKIKEKTVIQPGDTLRIPDRAGVFHKAKKKENLNEIAKKYKVSPEKIRKANGLSSTVLAKGSEIFLPGAKPLPEIHYIRQKVFAWPIKAQYRLTSGFGWRVHPISGNKAFHTGIDIGAKMKTPIHAAADGVVAFAGDGGSYGNMILLRHKNGLFTVYGHASKLIAKKGQYVKRGQKIALVGSTGASTGAHLHFEVKSTEKHVNPHIALKKSERVAVKRKNV
ncbi:MAG: M23 family metallopeptidase [Spirochaetes bacterium]|nr:M23 family metallopeptidase [Spirochaetota bacterium]MBX3723884.1 M23 family metallopeptidase [Turneriella sp.]